MFLPIKTDRQLHATPWINVSLIAANIAVFLLTRNQIAQSAIALGSGLPHDVLVQQYPVLGYHLSPHHPSIIQFFSSAFLHADGWHLFGNMLFLWVFGNSVEDRLGKVGYLLFFLAAAVFSGLGHVLTSDAYALGASGAVAAVTGAYLALFPRSNVRIVYWFFFIGWFDIASMWLIAFYIAKDLVFYLIDFANVAYTAHLAGNLLGFAVGMSLLAARILPREPYDLLSLWQHARRRQQFRNLARQKPMWHSDAGPLGLADPKQPTSPEDENIMRLRAQISEALSRHDHPSAAALYLQLLQQDRQQVLSRQGQLDVASQLAADGRREDAAHAFELFLKTYPGDSDREQVQLMLALLYTRYLDRRQRAAEILDAALPNITDASRKQLAQQLLEEVR